MRWINRWRVDRLVSKAHEAVRLEAWDAALEASSRACDLDPHHIEALAVTALACFRLGQYPRAIDGYEEILLLKPGDVSARRNMAMALSKLKRWPQAYDLLKELAAERPADFEIRKALVYVAAQMGCSTPPMPAAEAIKQAIGAQHWPRVITLARQILEEQPQNGEVMLHLGVALYRSDRLDESCAWFRKAVEATQTGTYAFRHAPALHNLATACMKLHNWPEASESLESVQKMIRHNAPGTAHLKLANVLTNLIVCYREQHRPRLARAAYDCLVETDPEAAARIDPGSLNVPLGAKLRSAAPLGAKLDLVEAAEPDAPDPEPDADELHCTSCGASFPLGNNFCGKCGARAPELAAAQA